MARKKTIPTEEPEQLHPPENPEETAGEAAVSEFPLDGDDAECIFGAGPPEVLETQEAAGETGRRQGGSWRRRHTAGGRSFGRTCPHSGSIGHRAEGGGNSAGHI